MYLLVGFPQAATGASTDYYQEQTHLEDSCLSCVLLTQMRDANQDHVTGKCFKKHCWLSLLPSFGSYKETETH